MSIITLTVKGKRIRGTRKAQTYDGQADRTQPVEQAQTLTRWADKTQRASRDPHPLGHQPGHQGEWALVKETSRTQGKHPLH